MMSLQDVLPPTTRRYRYEGYHQCLRVLEQEPERLEREEVPLGCAYNPYSIMDIDECSFLKCFVNSGDKLLMPSWESYDHITQSALLKMESSAHAVAAGAFNTIFSAWARRVVDPLLSPTSTRTVRGQARTKKADISWSPREMSNGRLHKWPTFVGEVAWSERRTKLQDDIRLWLDDPDSAVNAAITISVLREKIMVESWKRGYDKAPSPNQKIEIFRNLLPGHPRVNGQLEIQFSDVFLRNKRDGERNFLLTASDMEELASHIWKYQYPIG
ncbi:unnamed protein product [Penicillium nalgiovense]|uniref:Uncharacterized protein n=2 Tax=Penicillium nalgiovense TaxID=60175 RepID=A0A9W4N3J2_PENNA|nr:unnamed protein product [Penicillium nalgiovense]CAG7956718.1 unnamed protein product [Penicillium nalgiovense]CAG7958258.1 unnamed protein product [Penicillium nalgiovense]CAG7966713.1 unnamed protein product [Penicillium nalgiovense]CAG7972383.1 unnamed protein product [Penicillium nalgiovense]